MRAETRTRTMGAAKRDKTRTAEARAETIYRRQVRAWKAGRS